MCWPSLARVSHKVRPLPPLLAAPFWLPSIPRRCLPPSSSPDRTVRTARTGQISFWGVMLPLNLCLSTTLFSFLYFCWFNRVLDPGVLVWFLLGKSFTKCWIWIRGFLYGHENVRIHTWQVFLYCHLKKLSLTKYLSFGDVVPVPLARRAWMPRRIPPPL